MSQITLIKEYVYLTYPCYERRMLDAMAFQNENSFCLGALWRSQSISVK